MKKSKRLENAYQSYLKMYRAKQRSMRKRGMEMFDKKLTKREYMLNRKLLIEEMKEETGKAININQTLVSEQQYKYNRTTGRRFLATAKKVGLEWSDSKLREIRAGKIDVSLINERLKIQNPEWSGKERAQYIAYEVFGSK